MTQRRGYSEWVKLVEEFEKSSSSLEDFAAKLGVKPSTFQFWFYKLRKQASRPSQFLPVDVVASAPKGRAGRQRWWKFWGGEKLLLETVDQILGYTSWRDTKTAILLFNRNKDFTAVLKKIPGVVHQHAKFKRDVPSYVRETASRYMFTHRDDPDREFTLTICAFNVPT